MLSWAFSQQLGRSRILPEVEVESVSATATEPRKARRSVMHTVDLHGYVNTYSLILIVPGRRGQTHLLLTALPWCLEHDCAWQPFLLCDPPSHCSKKEAVRPLSIHLSIHLCPLIMSKNSCFLFFYYGMTISSRVPRALDPVFKRQASAASSLSCVQLWRPHGL